MDKLRLSLISLLLSTISITATQAQDIFLTPLSKYAASPKTGIDKLAISNDGRLIACSDAKGNIIIYDTDSNSVVHTQKGVGKCLLLNFLTNNNSLIAVKTDGELIEYALKDFSKTTRTQRFSEPMLVTLDPNQLFVTSLSKKGLIEVYDLRANMTQARIATVGDVKNPLFMGFDRFGQQLAVINNIGNTFSWEVINQRFLRELKLQSGEYANSRSVIQSAASSRGADFFVVGMQEVFIPKGGLKAGQQPERRNVLISYDWTTGQENKRISLQYRIDGMTMGPTSSSVTYFCEDTRNIFLVNLDKGEIRQGTSIDEKPSSISLSENGSMLAVGSAAGNVYLYDVIRNNPAEIKIINPPVNRNYGEETVRSTSLTLEGKIEGLDRINSLFINDQKISLNPDGTFLAPVELSPGKNRIRVAAQSSSSQVIEKDIYVNCEPSTSTKPTHTSSSANYKKRVALVIGNADYSAAGKLVNTVNDAKSMSATLKDLGFEVILLENATYEKMKNAVYAFGDKIQDVDVSIFFYAGHGMEVDGVNYLVPVDADIQSHLDIKQKCVPLTGVLNTMEFANDEGLNMVILDACRNNPFPAGKRGGAGLARVNAPSGTLIAYSTDPGSVASDGTGSNGLYTGELLKQLQTSQRIEDIFMNTRNSVERLSEGKQRPWEEARLKGVFYLK